MFNLFLKRRGPVVNILKRHVVKRQINNDASSRLYPRTSEYIKTVRKEFCLKQISRGVVNYKKYSSLPKPLEATNPRIVFLSFEDAYAHSILENNEKYWSTIIRSLPVIEDEVTENEVDNYLNKSWKSLPIPDIIKAFRRISHHAQKNDENILDEKYEKFIKYLITNCGQFTDLELRDVLLSIALWPISYTRHDEIFKSFYLALDKECVRRAPEWSVDELLLFSDHWFKIRLYRYTEFAYFFVKKLGNRPSKMKAENLVQFMFYVNSSRKHPKDMYNLEYRMEIHADELDLNELSVMAMGFFKSQSPIRNANLLAKIIHRVIEEIDTINEISLSAFMKIIRYSFTMQNEYAILWELVVSTIPQIPRLSLQALIHIILTTVKMRIFHPELLTCVAQRFSEEIKDARLKDMERLALALTCFNFTPPIQPNIFETIVGEISLEHRLPDLERYQKSLANLLQYLSVVNVYPKDLMAFTLDPANLAKTYGPTPFDIGQAVLVIDLNIDAEVPDYVGPRLDNRSRSIIAKGYVNKLYDRTARGLSARHRMLYEIVDTCEEIFGSSDMVHLDWILPHYKEADVIICLDKNNSPISVKSILSEIPFGNLKKRPENSPEGSKWVALVVGANNCYIRDTTQFLGKDSIKIRQLEKIGYKPIVIPWYEWPVKTNDRERKNYLKQMIFEQ